MNLNLNGVALVIDQQDNGVGTKADHTADILQQRNSSCMMSSAFGAAGLRSGSGRGGCQTSRAVGSLQHILLDFTGLWQQQQHQA